MTTPNSTPAPSVRQLVALVCLVAVLLAAGSVFYALTPVDTRVQLWPQLGKYLPQIGTTAGALLAWLGVRKVRAEHGEQLAQITQQTNGVLTARITAVVNEALDARGLTVPDPHPRVPVPVRRRHDDTDTDDEKG